MPPSSLAPPDSQVFCYMLSLLYLLHIWLVIESQINGCVVQEKLNSRVVKGLVNICINEANDACHCKQTMNLRPRSNTFHHFNQHFLHKTFKLVNNFEGC